MMQYVPLAETQDTLQPPRRAKSRQQEKGNRMWSAQEVARHQVRRQANGLDMAAVAGKVAEAAARERETAEQLRRGGSFSEFETDLERLTAIWAAKHVEWRRVRDLMAQAG